MKTSSSHASVRLESLDCYISYNDRKLSGTPEAEADCFKARGKKIQKKDSS